MKATLSCQPFNIRDLSMTMVSEFLAAIFMLSHIHFSFLVIVLFMFYNDGLMQQPLKHSEKCYVIRVSKNELKKTNSS